MARDRRLNQRKSISDRVLQSAGGPKAESENPVALPCRQKLATASIPHCASAWPSFRTVAQLQPENRKLQVNAELMTPLRPMIAPPGSELPTEVPPVTAPEVPRE